MPRGAVPDRVHGVTSVAGGPFTVATPTRRWRFSPSVLAYGPLLAQVVITRRCNLTCGYCNEYDEVSPPGPAELIKAPVDELAELGLLFCEYTGGETLLHPDLVELVRYASSYKFNERWIITNGYLLTEKIVKQLNDAGLTHLQISIDGVTVNSITVKVLKPLRKKIEYLQKHAKFTVQINAVLGAGNDEEVLEVMRFASEAGLRQRASIIHDGQGGMILDERGKQLMHEVSALVGKRFSESGDYRARLLATGEADFKCRAGSRYLYVDEHGDRTGAPSSAVGSRSRSLRTRSQIYVSSSAHRSHAPRPAPSGACAPRVDGMNGGRNAAGFHRHSRQTYRQQQVRR